ncbi:Ldh family oxidoreductase [Kitasatospora arboriphila]|uniref:Uncharacterized protein n=1 Tax=Kitasatospora arboriphila TaxID=258052 RepID=A0ABN1U4R3_9ACTN
MTAPPRPGGPPPLRVVVVTGAPGAGKTEVGRRLVRRYRGPAALIDTDTAADVYPWRADERQYALIDRNLRALLASYREWGAEVVVVSGVMLPGRTLDRFADLLADPDLEWVFYGLRAGPGQLAARIRGDHKMQEADGRLAWGHLDAEVPGVPGVRLVDTDRLTLDGVVDAIAARDVADLAPRAVAPPVPAPSVSASPVPGAPTRRVTAEEAAAVCRAALAGAGFPARTAAATADDLVAAELTGRPSHGLLRVPEYLAEAAAGRLAPAARPRVRRTGPTTSLLLGADAPGAEVRRRLVAELSRAADLGPVVVGLRGAGHLGGLAPLGREVAERGLVLLGFVNFRGAGARVAPAGGTAGVWATNPVLLACPAPPGPPLVVDMSTSAAAEGAVRSALLAGRPVPPDLLTGPDGRPVTDPALLYTEPALAALLLLGGAAEHKGHALAALVEVLAGAVAGAGHAARPRGAGNGGLFVAFPVDALGRSAAAVGREAARLEAHLRAVPTVRGRPAARLPGRAPAGPAGTPDTLTVPAALWAELCALAGRPETRPTDPPTRRSLP